MTMSTVHLRQNCCFQHVLCNHELEVRYFHHKNRMLALTAYNASLLQDWWKCVSYISMCRVMNVSGCMDPGSEVCTSNSFDPGAEACTSASGDGSESCSTSIVCGCMHSVRILVPDWCMSPLTMSSSTVNSGNSMYFTGRQFQPK